MKLFNPTEPSSLSLPDLRSLDRRRTKTVRVLDDKIWAAQQHLARCAALGRRDCGLQLMRRLHALHNQRQALVDLAPARSPVPTLVVSSWMLKDSFGVCTATEDEGLHLLVGVEHDGVLIPTRIIECDYTRRTAVRATATREGVHKAMADTAEAGHRVFAIIHSHPGSGPEANHPSSIDLRTHELWEGISSVIGGIWSRDGYLRWFTSAKPFEVQVVGTQMERLGDRLWRLTDENVAQHPQLAGQTA